MLVRILSCCFLAIAFCQLSDQPAWAISAEEQLKDNALEARARDLSKQLRCLVCQNQSIDDSDSDLAKDLRNEVRSQLLQGRDDDQILSDLQARYGDYVLLKPPVSLATSLLWLAPVIVLFFGVILIFLSIRKRQSSQIEPMIQGDEIKSENQISSRKDSSKKDAGLSHSLIFFTVVFGGLIFVSGALYWFGLGAPQIKSRPFAERAAEIAASRQQTSQHLKDLQSDYEDAKQASQDRPEHIGRLLDWAFAAAKLGKIEEEITVLRKALLRSEQDPVIGSMLAEALTRLGDGQVVPEARELIKEILVQQPSNPRALFLQGLAYYQDGTYDKALFTWQYLSSISPEDAPYMPILQENIRYAAQKAGIELPDSGPSAMLSKGNLLDGLNEAQQENIKAMVAGLEERLKDNPDDLEGWLRLIRSYDVLEQEHKAIMALIQLSELQAQSLEIQLAVLERILVKNRSQANSEFLEYADIALKRAFKLSRSHPETLFFAGHFAKITGRLDEARRYWSELLEAVPADNEIAKLLKKEIDALSP